MFAGKYTIHYTSYPYRGFYDGEYATDHLLLFLVKFIVLSAKYPIVDVEFRDTERMSEVDA